MRNFQTEGPLLRRNFGIEFMDRPRGYQDQPQDPMSDFAAAMDAQPTMITAPNAGIPAYLTTYVNPKVIETVVTPMRAAQIYGELKQGDWLTETQIFMMIENVGYVSGYGDYNQNGRVDVNEQWPNRQSFHYQTWVGCGEKEEARAGLAGLALATRKQIARVLVLNKFQNTTYLFGVAGGLKLYGALNDPNLPAAISPTIKTGALTTWVSTTDPNQIYNDFQKLYTQLNIQMGGVLDMSMPIKVVLPTSLQVSLTNANNFRTSGKGLVSENFPNLTIEFLPEAATANGNIMQMFVPEYEGQRTVNCGFTEKLRAHRMETYSTYWRQKMSQGTWGTIWFRPIFCAQMIGI